MLLFLILSLTLHFQFKSVAHAQNVKNVNEKGKFEGVVWRILDKHILPQWYDEAKFGIFVHWGLYSVPAFGINDDVTHHAEWFMREWLIQKLPPFVKFMEENYPKNFTYADFAKLWKAECFNASEWADIVEGSGARYFVMTTKHHDGFTLWPSSTSPNWNSLDTGPQMDIIGQLRDAFLAKPNIHFGLYYSLYEWLNTLYDYDKQNNFTTQEYINRIMLPQIEEIVTVYHPEYIWADGDWEADFRYWKSQNILEWLYNKSPVKDRVVVNDRWGIGTACKHGDVKTCGIDRFNPHAVQAFKWENAMTIDKYSWGFRKDAPEDEYLTSKELIHLLIDTVSNGGNLLMNIGPAADGTISDIFKDRLRNIGQWLSLNGESIYGTTTWRIQKEGNVRYTRKSEILYAILLNWPRQCFIDLNYPYPTAGTQVFLLGHNIAIQWQLIESTNGIRLILNEVDTDIIANNAAWAFKLTYVE